MKLRQLTPADACGYRSIMLHAYASEPDAFTSTVSEREPLPLSWWESRISDAPGASEWVIGAFADTRLVGLAGLTLERRERTRHKATLFGTYVLPEHRGSGVGKRIVQAVLSRARSQPGLRVVQLTVTESNLGAVRLYESCGFKAFGSEPLAVCVGSRYVTKLHMWCPVAKNEGA